MLNDKHLSAYINEIQKHCQAAASEYFKLEKTFDNSRRLFDDSAWLQASTFLTHCAMISKYLDPVRPEGIALDRREQLRAELGIDDGLKILSREARDNIEHFDERLDALVAEDAGGSFSDVFIGSRRKGDESNLLPPEFKTTIKRAIIFDERVIVLRDRLGELIEVPLQPLAEEVLRILVNASDWLSAYNQRMRDLR